MKRIARSAIVAHPAEEMFALVNDVESYPRFLPWCTAAHVEERMPYALRATLTVGVKGIRHSFTTQNELSPGRSMRMRLVRGPFRRFAGEWRFKPLSEQACLIEFALEYEMAGPFAKLLGPLFDRLADTMVDAFTRRAAELHGHA